MNQKNFLAKHEKQMAERSVKKSKKIFQNKILKDSGFKGKTKKIEEKTK